MKTLVITRLGILATAMLTLALPTLAAQIVVGQVAPLSGPDAVQGRAYAAGMQLFFNAVNRAGGVNGHTFSLVSKDDGGRPEDTVKLTRQLLADERPLVLAGYFGDRNVAEVVKAGVLEKEKVALIGYRASESRVDTPWLYNVRASVRDEIAKVTEHLATIGVTSLGLLHEDGPGAAVLVSTTEAAARKSGSTVVLNMSYEAGTSRVSDAIDGFLKARPQAILLVCNGAAAARFIEQYRANGGGAQIFVSSSADMERVAKRIAEERLSFVSSVMRGVAIAQVVPSPYDNSRLAKELSDAVAQAPKPSQPTGYVMMEGYITAKVIVEAIRRQGQRPTREAMASVLDGIEGLNLGGYVISYKPGARSGSKYVELTIISDTGKIRQ